MEPDLNIREQIVQIIERLVETFQRLCQTNEGQSILLRWRPICIQRDGQNKSIVRFMGDHMPRRLVSDPFLSYYRSLKESVMARKSVIREIGSRLPLQPSKRPYFYMLHKPAINGHARGIKDTRGSQFVHSTPCQDTKSPGSFIWDAINDSCRDTTFQSSVVVSDDAVRKITALEDELNRLRAQIAGFVLKQDSTDTTSMVPPPPLAPPLPPPPPPLPTTLTQTPKKYNKYAISHCIGKPAAALVSDGHVLDMTAILKDLNQVKLKAVERSPGGTPIRKAPRKTKGTDPASIIADALKNKFAKSRMAVASPDKENLESDSPGNSFNNTPSPQPYFRKPLEKKVDERQASYVEFKTHAIPLRV